MKKFLPLLISLILAGMLLALIFILEDARQTESISQGFDAQRAYQHVLNQVNLGPRTPGSQAHAAAVEYIQRELADNNWEVELQQVMIAGHEVKNIVARRGSGKPLIILGAHYDSRLKADNDPDPSMQNLPVPGANDGASGVAVLLELGRSLPAEMSGQVWLVFFDLEDQGRLPGYDWILGSRAFAARLEEQPDAVVILDMIGDADLDVYYEKNSTPDLRAEIWAAAGRLSYEEYIIPQEKYSILDDHTPFLELGIPAVDMIDFDYRYYHTTEDTADKVSAESLKIIGDTLLEWLLPIISVGK